MRQKRSENNELDSAMRRSRLASRLEFGISPPTRDTGGLWSIRAMVFEEFARWLPVTILCCAMFGALSMLVAEHADSPYGRESWYMRAALFGMFPFANTVLIGTSVKYGGWRIWPLGIATAAGVPLGLWISKGNWAKARHLEPYSVDPKVWIGAALLGLGWLLIAGWLQARRWMRARQAEP